MHWDALHHRVPKMACVALLATPEKSKTTDVSPHVVQLPRVTATTRRCVTSRTYAASQKIPNMSAKNVTIYAARLRQTATGPARGSSRPSPPSLRSANLLRRLSICIAIFACQNGTGINAINYYSPTIFKSIGVTVRGSLQILRTIARAHIIARSRAHPRRCSTTGVFGIIKFLGALVWLFFLVDRCGRRSLLLVGSVGGALAMYYIGAYIAIARPAEHVSNKLSPGGISAMAFFYLWTCFYGPTWNGKSAHCPSIS